MLGQLTFIKVGVTTYIINISLPGDMARHCTRVQYFPLSTTRGNTCAISHHNAYMLSTFKDVMHDVRNHSFSHMEVLAGVQYGVIDNSVCGFHVATQWTIKRLTVRLVYFWGP